MGTNRNTKILRNSFWLYLRMILNTGIALFTSRVLLGALGANDFGTANLLNALIVMFLFFSAAISNILQRYLNIQIETGNVEKAQTFFSMVVIFTFLSTATILIGESFFCEWILVHKLAITAEKAASAKFLFYCLLFAVFFQTFLLPWQEAILAKEKMGMYAVLCLSNSALKLILALFLSTGICTRMLEFYGLGLIAIGFVYWLAAVIFCCRKVPEANFRLIWEWKIGKEMLPFFSYDIIGGTLYNFATQGIVVLLGIFFTPAVNTAYAIALQIQIAVFQLSSYLAMAIKPQMIQSYAGGEIEYVRKLFFSACKLSFFAQFFVVTPIVLELSYILKLWLKIVPRYTDIFTYLLLVSVMILTLDVVAGLIYMATGENKNFEIKGRLITISSLAIAYIVLKFNAPPWSAVAVRVWGNLCVAIYLLWDIKRQIQISLVKYLKEVLGVLTLCVVFSWGILFSIKSILPFGGFPRFLVLSVFSLIVNLFLCFYFGCNKEEKKFFAQFLTSFKSFLRSKIQNCNP